MAYDPDVLDLACVKAEGWNLTTEEVKRLAQHIQYEIREEIRYILIVRKHAKRQG